MSDIEISKCKYSDCEYCNNGICNQTTLSAPTSKQVALCEDVTGCFIKDLYNRYRSAADGNIELSNKMAKLKKENEILRKNLEEKCILPDTISDIAHLKELESLRSQLAFMVKTHKNILERLQQLSEGNKQLEKRMIDYEHQRNRLLIKLIKIRELCEEHYCDKIMCSLNPNHYDDFECRKTSCDRAKRRELAEKILELIKKKSE